MIVGFTNASAVRSADIVAMLKGVKGFSLDVVTMRVSDKGLYMQGMDQSHVCLFEYSINSRDVARFEYSEKRDAACLSVSAGAIDKVFHCYRDEQSITLASSGRDPTVLTVTLEGGSYPQVNIGVPLHNVEGDDLLTVPTVEFDVDVTVTSPMLSRTVDQLALFSDRVEVDCREDGMVWKASGDSA